MTKQDGYILEQPEYPERGKRVQNLIGVMERDHEGWLWYELQKEEESVTNRNTHTLSK